MNNLNNDLNTHARKTWINRINAEFPTPYMEAKIKHRRRVLLLLVIIAGVGGLGHSFIMGFLLGGA